MPVLTIAAVCFTLALTVLLPVGLMIFFKKKGGSWAAFGIGAAVFVLFAMILESALHTVLFLSPLGGVLQNNLWLYALYGGLAAGIFEETGRFLAFRFLLKKHTEPITALSYGAGHGGTEAFLIVGLSMLSNLALILMASAGIPESSPLFPMAEEIMQISPGMFLWAALERASAILFHISSSVLVFAAVHGRKKLWLYPAAVLLHACLDLIAVAANGRLPIAAVEGITLLFAAAVALYAGKIYRELKKGVDKPL